MHRKILAIAALFLAMAGTSARAKIVLDLTPAASTTGFGTAAIGGGFFVTNNEVQPTGTGVIQPFLTLQQTGQERGYNTDGGLPLDTTRPQFTDAVQLGSIQSQTIGGVEYIPFLMDV